MSTPESRNHLLYEVLAPKILAHIEEFIVPTFGRVGFMSTELSRDGKYLDLFFRADSWGKPLRESLARAAPALKSHLATSRILARMPILRIKEYSGAEQVLDILHELRAKSSIKPINEQE